MSKKQKFLDKKDQEYQRAKYSLMRARDEASGNAEIEVQQ